MVKKRSRKKLCEEIKKTREEIEKKKEDLISIKNLISRHNLDSDYLKKKNMIANNVRLLKNKLAVVHKLQSILYSEGTLLTVNLDEWLTMLERLEKLSKELDAEYQESLANISEDNCQIGDIASRIDFPEDDITLLLQDAFDKFGKSVSRRIEFNQYKRLPLSQQQQQLERSLEELEEKKSCNDRDGDNYNWRGDKRENKKISGRKFDYYDVLGPVFDDKDRGKIIFGKNCGNNSGLDDSGIGLEERFDWFNDPIDSQRLQGPNKK